MKYPFMKSAIIAALLTSVAAPVGFAADQPSPTTASLQAGFQQPPHEARPAVLWNWMGGLLSKEGITKDLESLSAQGFGRVMIMQMPDQCPFPRQWSYQDYPGKIKCLSDDWFALMNFAIGECDRLGMQLGVFICPGWGHAGGPWVPPHKGTKMLAMTSAMVKGPVRYDQTLPRKQPIGSGSRGNDVPPWNKDHALLPQPREIFSGMRRCWPCRPGARPSIPPRSSM
jgi:hypothetical protein